jgi:hypothetical protein
MRRLTAMCLALATAASVLLAHDTRAESGAADRETARQLMDEGRTKEKLGDWEGALQAYQAAHKLVHVPSTGLSVARAQVALGRLVEARDTALTLTLSAPEHEPAVLKKARAEAAALAESLRGRIPLLTFAVRGPDAAVAWTARIDGAEVPPSLSNTPRAVNPGTHAIQVSAAACETWSGSVEVKEAERKTLEITLTPTTDAPPETSASPSSRPVAPVYPSSMAPSTSPPIVSEPARSGTAWWTVGALCMGGAGLAVGAITGFVSLNKVSDIKSQCDGNRCPTTLSSEGDVAHRLAIISDITLAVGAVGVAIGIYGLATSHSREAPKTAAVHPVIGAGFAGLAGRF